MTDQQAKFLFLSFHPGNVYIKCWLCGSVQPKNRTLRASLRMYCYERICASCYDQTTQDIGEPVYG